VYECNGIQKPTNEVETTIKLGTYFRRQSNQGHDKVWLKFEGKKMTLERIKVKIISNLKGHNRWLKKKSLQWAYKNTFEIVDFPLHIAYIEIKLKT